MLGNEGGGILYEQRYTIGLDLVVAVVALIAAWILIVRLNRQRTAVRPHDD